nr:helix-turn-helix transcriptional regulator [Pseudofrankia saprophytica]
MVTARTPRSTGNIVTVRRMLLGAQLRRLREAAGATRGAAAHHLRSSEAKISRLEQGRVPLRQRDVEALLNFYGVTGDAEQASFLSMVHDADQQGWWQSNSDYLPDWFQPYPGLEESASLIRSYEVHYIPTFLQTEDYARAQITQNGRGKSRGVIEDRVAMRMNRQRVLARPDGPRLWVVLDEIALRRPVGSAKIMRSQIRYLIDLMNTPTLTLQIMPYDLGGHAAEGGQFSILRFPEAVLPDVVYLEFFGGGTYLDQRGDVDHYMQAWDRLCIDSTAPSHAVDVLTKIMTLF